MNTSEQIRNFRLKLGWGTKDVAEFLGYSRRTVYYWENGERRIPLEAFLKLQEEVKQHG